MTPAKAPFASLTTGMTQRCRDRIGRIRVALPAAILPVGPKRNRERTRPVEVTKPSLSQPIMDPFVTGRGRDGETVPTTGIWLPTTGSR